MRSILRFLIVLAVALTLGFAAYAFIPPLNPSVSLTQTAYSAAGHDAQGAGALVGAARASDSGAPSGEYRGGHPQGAGGAASAFVAALGKFLAIFSAIALAKFGLGKIVSRKGRTA
jgi:hypothetical protein